MIKTLIFSSVAAIVLFAISAMCMVAVVMTFVETGTQKPEFGYFMIGGLFSFFLGKVVQR